MKCSGLGNRDRCLEEAMLFRDTDLIKAITGVRRCGESGLLDLIRMAIESEGVAGRGFVSVNLESKGTGIKTEDQLYGHIRGCPSDKGRAYVFIDEPQRIDSWQDAVNAMRADFDCDIYLTGSNAYLLSSELATYLSGRFSATISTRSAALSAGCPGLRPPGALALKAACSVYRAMMTVTNSGIIFSRSRLRPVGFRTSLPGS